MSTNFAGQIPS